MSESRATASQADIQADLDQMADVLYGRRPDEFAAARDEHVRKAREEGRPALARELAKLRRPTQSAWLVNLLWRDQRDVMEQLFQLAADLSQAQSLASGPEMQRLTAQRRGLEAALIRRARALAEQAGVPISAAMEREAQETLAAALAQPEVAEEVRTGRLVKPASYAGFGPLVSSPAPSAAPKPSAPSATPRTDVPGERDAPTQLRPPKVDEVQLQAAKRAWERREAAERHVHEARAVLETAAGELADRERAVDTAQRQLRELQQQVRDTQQRLLEIQGQAAAAEQSTRVAARQRDQADKAHQAALRSVESAEQQLQALAESR